MVYIAILYKFYSLGVRSLDMISVIKSFKDAGKLLSMKKLELTSRVIHAAGI